MKLDADDIRDLAPVIREAVRATLTEIADADAKLNGKLGYREAEAAALLSVPRHVLGDLRRRGGIRATKCGKCYLYSRETLARYLAEGGEP